MLIVFSLSLCLSLCFSLSVCLSVSLSISLYVYSVYDFYNNNNNNKRRHVINSVLTQCVYSVLTQCVYSGCISDWESIVSFVCFLTLFSISSVECSLEDYHTLTYPRSDSTRVDNKLIRMTPAMLKYLNCASLYSSCFGPNHMSTVTDGMSPNFGY